MTRRPWSIRSKLTALLLLPLVSLATLWAYAAHLTLGNALTLRHENVIGNHLANPLGLVAITVQTERRASMVKLAAPATGSQGLHGARAITDGAVRTFLAQAHNENVRDDENAGVRVGVDRAERALKTLDRVRRGVDTRAVTPARVMAAYTSVVDSIAEALRAMTILPDQSAQDFGQALYMLVPAGDLLSQEDALISAAAASPARRLDRAGYSAVVQDIGSQRVGLAEAVRRLPPPQRVPFESLVSPTGALGRLAAMEEQLIQAGPTAKKLPFSIGQWRKAFDTENRVSSTAALEDISVVFTRTGPPAQRAFIALILAGLLGFVALVVSVVMAIRTTRSLLGDVTRLRSSAQNLTDDQLRDVVGRLRRGESVDIGSAMERPPFVNREMAALGSAFEALQLTAVELAHEDVRLHQGISDIYLNLARRNQTLVHRQLSLLDVMERHEDDARTLEQLYQLDQLATRMRRYAEGLIILSGSAPGRLWRHSVSVVDVIRAAVAETEFFARVVILPVPAVGVLGRAAADVIHLLAELIENAEAFSPPDSEVRVGASTAAGGLIIEVDDRGLGMPAEELDAANARISSPVDVTSLDSTRLGLVTVGRLAQRHDIQVTLRSSPYGGVSAVVLVPGELLDWPASGGSVTQSVPAVGAGVARAGLESSRRGLGELTEHDFGPAVPAHGNVAVPAGADEVRRDYPQPAEANVHKGAPAGPRGALPSGASPWPELQGEPETIDGLPRRVPQQSLALELQRESDELQAGRLMDWSGSATGGHAAAAAPAAAPLAQLARTNSAATYDQQRRVVDGGHPPVRHSQAYDPYTPLPPQADEWDVSAAAPAPQPLFAPAGSSGPGIEGAGRPEYVRSMMASLQAAAARARVTETQTEAHSVLPADGLAPYPRHAEAERHDGR
ncbi:nitrate- and nitrite sensing domain-containing protein [Streptomyces sp. NPDC007856]|uniref:sensor histidine kinase n=1 Tax=Streptomyces sp. NPDC007856 TaxID=3364781 RepID=UPI0036942088